MRRSKCGRSKPAGARLPPSCTVQRVRGMRTRQQCSFPSHHHDIKYTAFLIKDRKETPEGPLGREAEQARRWRLARARSGRQGRLVVVARKRRASGRRTYARTHVRENTHTHTHTHTHAHTHTHTHTLSVFGGITCCVRICVTAPDHEGTCSFRLASIFFRLYKSSQPTSSICDKGRAFASSSWHGNDAMHRNRAVMSALWGALMSLPSAEDQCQFELDTTKLIGGRAGAQVAGPKKSCCICRCVVCCFVSRAQCSRRRSAARASIRKKMT